MNEKELANAINLTYSKLEPAKESDFKDASSLTEEERYERASRAGTQMLHAVNLNSMYKEYLINEYDLELLSSDVKSFMELFERAKPGLLEKLIQFGKENGITKDEKSVQ